MRERKKKRNIKKGITHIGGVCFLTFRSFGRRTPRRIKLLKAGW